MKKKKRIAIIKDQEAEEEIKEVYGDQKIQNQLRRGYLSE